MKRLNNILAAGLAVLTLLASCSDDINLPSGGDDTGYSLSITLVLPGDATDTSASSRSIPTTPTDAGTALERYVADDDIHLVLYDEDDVITAVPDFTVESATVNDVTYRKLTVHFTEPQEGLKFRVLANMAGSCSEFATGAEAQAAIKALIGSSDSDLLDRFVVDGFDSDGNFPIDGVTRCMPMHSDMMGTYDITADTGINVPMYRSLVKIGIRNNTDKLDVRHLCVYYQLDKGRFASTQTPDPSTSLQYTATSLPTSWSHRSEPVYYDFPVDGSTILPDIDVYVPEQINTDSDTPLILYVGGYYADDEEETWYRIDFTDTCKKDGKAFDVVRNHWYVFSIEDVTGPGYPDPDPDKSLSELTVTLTDVAIDMEMMDIIGQYTLEVDCANFVFPGAVASPMVLNVFTDGEEWRLATDLDEDEKAIFEGQTGSSGDVEIDDGGGTTDADDLTDDTSGKWFLLTETNHTSNRGSIEILPLSNLMTKTSNGEGNTHTTIANDRQGYFYIISGQIIKKIYVTQSWLETANCYLITSPGTYTLKADIRGNGIAETENGVSLAFGYDADDPAKIKDAYVCKILWETSEGLVTIADKFVDAINPITGCIEYEVHDVEDYYDGLSVFTKGANNFRAYDTEGHGGNALIGVFDRNGNLLWSWHIWVVADYADGVKTNYWATGVYMMDRYLGAYSNVPGPRAYGLLYQWGRKDPFIGPWRGINALKGGGNDYEREFYKVKKQHTVPYTHYGVTYDWKDWSAADGEETLTNTTAHPTTLQENGFLSLQDEYTENRKGLWGTTSSSITVADNGWKTMWDPCPAGYRVPSIHSFNFGSSISSSVYYNNYTANNQFVPYGTTSQYGTGSSASQFYGFWLKYGSHNSQPSVSGLYSITNTGVQWLQLGGSYSGSIKCFGTCGTNTWNGSGVYYRYLSSIHVNGAIWLNAPNSSYDGKRPAGVLMHGAEFQYSPTADGDSVILSNTNIANKFAAYVGWRNPNKTETGEWYYLTVEQDAEKALEEGITMKDPQNFKDNRYGVNYGGGRHWHAINDGPNKSSYGWDLNPLPNYAANVLPVGDKDNTGRTDPTVSKTDITLLDGNSYTATFDVVSDEDWQVIHPGGKWVSIIPDKGEAGTTTTVTVTWKKDLYPTVTDTDVTIIISFAFGTQKQISVHLVP